VAVGKAKPEWSLSRMGVSLRCNASAPAVVRRLNARNVRRKNPCSGRPEAHPNWIAPPIVHDVLRSPGQPLDKAARSFFEPRFGHDFSQVRVHADHTAAASAKAVHALAYTVGSNVVFGAGHYAPTSGEGRRLLAHELTHVVQQGTAGQDLQKLALDSNLDGPSEREAESNSRTVVSGGSVSVPPQLTYPKLQRQPDPLLTADAAGGCGVCYRGDVKAIGRDAHELIQAEFRAKYSPFLETNRPLCDSG